jgi:hypothetical protein
LTLFTSHSRRLLAGGMLGRIPMAVPDRGAKAYLKEGWQVVRPAWGATVLLVLVWAILTNIAATLCFLPLLIVGGPLTGGLYLVFAKRLLGLGGDVGDLFLGFRRFGPTTIVYLAATFVFFAVLIVLAAPIEAVDFLGVVDTDDFEAMPVVAQVGLGAYALVVLVLAATAAGIVLTFAMPLAMFDPAPGSLGRALALTRTHLGKVVALNLWGALYVVVATAVGILLCLVGSLVLQPLALGAVAVAQLALLRDLVGLDAAKLAPFLPAVPARSA